MPTAFNEGLDGLVQRLQQTLSRNRFLGVLVAGDDLVGWHFAVDRARLLVLDACAAIGVELVQVNLARV